ncbi:replication protein A 70 kDa DNA-binding subunit-like [Panonychus citri]|uniref:replication protein A 70 kDa DNA-binding subunit-like n=1 Tax=Panonychus citri TaxID=50023 RepID=UPI0023073588|nr:replication protein A 70 kDa DNA-binding subunit-like [Panonychus citri]
MDGNKRPSKPTSQEKKLKQNNDKPETIDDTIIPIKELTLYSVNWCILGKVVNKTQLKTFENSRNAGKYFSFVMADNTSEIKITAFGDQCDKYFDQIMEQKNYKIKYGTIKDTNKTYSTINHDYEININSSTVIVESPENITIVETNLAKLNSIPDHQIGTIVDVIGIIKYCEDANTITTKDNKTKTKRDITIMDDTATSITITLWEAEANNYNPIPSNIIMARKLRIISYQGLKLSTTAATTITINPQIPESDQLRNWYQQHNTNEPIQLSSALYQHSYLYKINYEEITKLANLTLTTNVIATITAILQSTFYNACPNTICKKKVEKPYCENCKANIIMQRKMVLTMKLTDATCSIYVKVFDEEIQKLLHINANDLEQLSLNDKNKYNLKINTIILTKWSFKIKSTINTYNETTSISNKIISLDEITSPTYIHNLKHQIDTLTKLTK